ncbi:uncharacterized protein [Lepeophtheirus salmonis]|uniref:uncharacterized protein isoform X2 n=1 Tax=Lepeophtheirus salmonis TaxID=72036 RepID=UPI001AE22127|nr:uncharacterized protein LOC121119462 isoform X2 [Lepeophtheirus salmonis]
MYSRVVRLFIRKRDGLILAKKFNSSFNQVNPVVFIDGVNVYRPSFSQGFEHISKFRDRKSVIESPMILKIVHESNSFIESIRKEGIRPWNWFDVSLAKRLTVYAKSGIFPSDSLNVIYDLESLKKEFSEVNSILCSDLRELLQEFNFSPPTHCLTNRTVLIQNESSKMNVVSKARSFPFYKRIVSSKFNNSILLITDSPNNANELRNVLSNSYENVQCNSNFSNNSILERIEFDLLNAGYIMKADQISSIVKRIISIKTPIALDFCLFDANHSLYPEVSLRRKIALKMCIPGYPELRFHLNSTSIEKGGLGDLFAKSEVVKIFQNTESRQPTVMGLRLLREQSKAIPKGIFNINFAIQTLNHVYYGDYLEIRNSGPTKYYSYCKSVKNFVMPIDFCKGALPQMLALYFYFSGLVMNREMIKLIEERSDIELEFSGQLEIAYKRKTDFFHRYCYRTIHIQDLRSNSTPTSLNENIDECFKELETPIESKLLKSPFGVVRLCKNAATLNESPFLSQDQLIVAEQKYQLKISPIGENENVHKKYTKRFIQYGEFLPKWEGLISSYSWTF